LDCEVEVVELMGEENIIHVASGNDEYVLKTTKDFKPRIGETIKVYLSYSEIHLFDSETGQTICN
jgi:ABC-type sugar transport system ATPase subunit